MADSKDVDILRADAVAGFRQLVHALGGDVEALFREFGLRPDVLEEPDRFISYSAVVLATEAAAHRFGMPDFGLRLSDLQHPESYGPLWLLMKSAPTVRDGMLLGIKHVSFYVPAQRYRIFPSADGQRVCIEMLHRVLNLPSVPQTSENVASQLQRFLLELSDHQARPAEVHFRHAQVGRDTQYTRHFGVMPQFESHFDGIAISVSDYHRRIPDQSPLLKLFVDRFIATDSPATSQPTTHQVAALLHTLARANMDDLDTVATMTGMHPRTLQRRLHAEGARFETLRDEAKKQLALQLLAQHHIRLAQVGDMLGYADQSVLTRACQRWFGKTPLQMRKPDRSGSPEKP